MVSDLEEAFLQIAVNSRDRDYLKFLWFDNDKEVIYRYKRLPLDLVVHLFC